MEKTKIIEDKETGKFHVVRFEEAYPAQYETVGVRDSREEAEKLLPETV